LFNKKIENEIKEIENGELEIGKILLGASSIPYYPFPNINNYLFLLKFK